jgi:hypothetical protein
LLDEVRQETARRLLATDMQPGEIAFLLGFEEINFFQARIQRMGRHDAESLARGANDTLTWTRDCARCITRQRFSKRELVMSDKFVAGPTTGQN